MHSRCSIAFSRFPLLFSFAVCFSSRARTLYAYPVGFPNRRILSDATMSCERMRTLRLATPSTFACASNCT